MAKYGVAKCPYCGSSNLERTNLGEVENFGSYLVSGAGFIASKLASSAIGIRSKYEVEKVAKFIPREFKCNRCGKVFHEQEHK